MLINLINQIITLLHVCLGLGLVNLIILYHMISLILHLIPLIFTANDYLYPIDLSHVRSQSGQEAMLLKHRHDLAYSFASLLLPTIVDHSHHQHRHHRLC